MIARGAEAVAAFVTGALVVALITIVVSGFLFWLHFPAPKVARA